MNTLARYTEGISMYYKGIVSMTTSMVIVHIGMRLQSS